MKKKKPTRRGFEERGTSIIEFAMIAPLLFGLLIGSYALGCSVSRLVQASSVCRIANVLVARGFDLAKPENQKLVLRTAAGLGLPQGKAVIFLTKVVKLGMKACAEGVPNWSGDAGACPNYQRYVIASRVAIGNAARWQSATGSPVSPVNGRGEVSDFNIAMIAGNRAAGFSDAPGAPSIVKLAEDEFAYVAEVFVDASDLSVPLLLEMDTIRVRNVS